MAGMRLSEAYTGQADHPLLDELVTLRNIRTMASLLVSAWLLACCGRAGFEGPISLTTSASIIRIHGTIKVRARGGLGHVTFEIVEGDGTIDADSGLFTAAAQPGRVTVRASDQVGNSAELHFSVWGLPGTPDSTFGDGGQVRTDLGDAVTIIEAIMVEPDDSVLAAGVAYNGDETEAFVARYQADGALDPLFGNDGITRIDTGSRRASALALTRTVAGHLMVAGFREGVTDDDFLVARLHSDGTVDTSFGPGGWVAIDFVGGNDIARGVALDAAGRIVIGGECERGGQIDFAATVLDDTGTIDSSFGVAGLASVDFAGNNDHGRAVAIDSLGRVVLAGLADLGGDTDFGVTRLTALGQPDPSFAGGAPVTSHFGGDDDGERVFVLAGDTIVVAGSINNAVGGDHMGFARYLSDGTPDPTFGNAGLAYDTASNIDSLADAVVQPDGKILGVGEGWGPGFSSMVVVRLNASGEPDATFGRHGNGRDYVEIHNSGATAVALQSTGQILLGACLTRSQSGYSCRADVARLTSAGELDLTFGSAGWAAAPDFGHSVDIAQFMAVQPDRKIVVGGTADDGWVPNFAVARYTEDGTLDSGFAMGGRLSWNTGNNIQFGYGGALQADGRILLVGRSWQAGGNWFKVLRLLQAGTPDPDFGDQGQVDIRFATGDQANAVVVRPDGRILVVGRTGAADWAIARLHTDGQLDGSFGPGGRVSLDLGTDWEEIYAVALQDDDKIVVAGSAGSQIAVGRLTADGALDATFGDGGVVISDIGSADHAEAVLVLADGNILVAGHCRDGDGSFACVMRYRSTGILEPQYGDAGVVTLRWGALGAGAYDIALQPDGLVVVTGWAQDDPGGSIVTSWLKANGELANDYADGGTARVAIDHDDQGVAVATDEEGHVVVAGSSGSGGSRDFVVLRFWQ